MKTLFIYKKLAHGAIFTAKVHNWFMVMEVCSCINAVTFRLLFHGVFVFFFSNVLDLGFVNVFKSHIVQIAFEVVKTSLVLSWLEQEKRKREKCKRFFFPSSSSICLWVIFYPNWSTPKSKSAKRSNTKPIVKIILWEQVMGRRLSRAHGTIWEHQNLAAATTSLGGLMVIWCRLL